MAGRVVQVSVSPGGVPKRAIPVGRVGPLGLAGDRQRNRALHGGPDRALCVFAQEAIDALRGEGHPVEAGALGENLTVAGLDWAAVQPGARFRVGGVLIEVTSFTAPCRTIRGAFRDGDHGRVSQARHPGWSRVYARVLVPGEIRPGDPVEPVTAAPRRRRLAAPAAGVSRAATCVPARRDGRRDGAPSRRPRRHRARR
jgi:MOSC domain-containing protein YiiM